MKISTLAVAIIPAMSIASYASTISYSGRVPSLVGSSYMTGVAGSFDVTQFDSSLGTLTGVELIINGYSSGGTVQYESTSPAAVNVSLNVITQIKVYDNDSSLIVITTPTQHTDFSASTYDGTTDYAGTSGISYTGGNATDTESETLTSGSDMSKYIGTGAVTFFFESQMYTSITGSSYSSNATNTDFYFTYEVVYTYTAVPEAASLGILSVSALALLARRRK